MSLERIVANVKPAVRRDRMENRDWLVVPMVMLTEGVHAGSNGPLYYPEAELSKTPAVWNHKPIVVYHPEINGVGVSACSPEILTSRKVGVIMNTTYDAKSGKLRAEAWLDPERVKSVDPRVMDALERNQLVEVSTGLFTDNSKEDGTWGDETYNAIARNYRPDHLAILPDQKGACSIADGAGLLQTNGAEMPEQLKSRIERVLREGLAINADASLQSILEDVSKAAAKRMGTDWMGWVEATYKDFVVLYEAQANKYLRLMYEMKDGKPVMSLNKPEEVRRVVEYRTLDGTFVGNTAQHMKGKKDMDREAKVNALIANGAPWSEGDRAFLMTCPEVALDHLHAQLKPTAPPAAPTANTSPDVDAWMAQAPPEIREVVHNARARDAMERQRLVTAITANKANTFPPADLNRMDIMTLQRIAAFAATSTPPAAPVANYAGAAGAPPTSATPGTVAVPTANAGTIAPPPRPPASFDPIRK